MEVRFLPLSAVVALRQWDYNWPVRLTASEIPRMYRAGDYLRKVQVVHEVQFVKEQTCYGIDIGIDSEAIQRQPESSRDVVVLVDRQPRGQNKSPGHNDQMRVVETVDKAGKQNRTDYC